MTKPGPSPEYRDLLNGRISVDEYLRQLKKQVNERLGVHPNAARESERRRLVAGR